MGWTSTNQTTQHHGRTAIRAIALLHPTKLAASCAFTRCQRCRQKAEDLRRGAIPGCPKLPDTLSASFAATGRGWAHPTFTCKRPAPGRRARWLEIQGTAASATAGLPAMAPTVKRGSRLPSCQPRLPHVPHAVVFPGQAACSQRRQQTPSAGAERQPLLGRATAPLKWLRSRYPRTRRTLAGAASGAGGVGRRNGSGYGVRPLLSSAGAASRRGCRSC